MKKSALVLVLLCLLINLSATAQRGVSEVYPDAQQNQQKDNQKWADFFETIWNTIVFWNNVHRAETELIGDELTGGEIIN